MTTFIRRRELHTRVTDAAYDQIRRYAAARNLTVYAAAERLVLVALEAVNASRTTDDAVKDALAQLVARVEITAAVADRALYGAMVGYAFSRAAALRGLATGERSERDKELVAIGEAAYRRQLDKLAEGR